MSTNQELLSLFQQLNPENRHGLLAFARFLVQEQQGEGKAAPQPDAPAPSTPAAEVQEPVDIPRPSRETIVEAIKRLTSTYPMLDKARLLNETSGLVAQHVMQGRGLVEVINELEAIFRSHYQKYRDGQGSR